MTRRQRHPHLQEFTFWTHGEIQGNCFGPILMRAHPPIQRMRTDLGGLVGHRCDQLRRECARERGVVVSVGYHDLEHMAAVAGCCHRDRHRFSVVMCSSDDKVGGRVALRFKDDAEVIGQDRVTMFCFGRGHEFARHTALGLEISA